MIRAGRLNSFSLGIIRVRDWTVGNKSSFRRKKAGRALGVASCLAQCGGSVAFADLIRFPGRRMGLATPGQVGCARAAAGLRVLNPAQFPAQGPYYFICGLGAAPDKPRGCGLSNFEESSACSDAEAVFGGVVCVSVIVAPRGILLVVHMANDRHRDHSDGCADDESRSYQLFHFTSIPSRLGRIATAARNIHAYLAEHLTSSQQCHTGYPWL